MIVEDSPFPCSDQHHSLLLSGILRLTNALKTKLSRFLSSRKHTDTYEQGRVIVSAEQCASLRARETERPDALFRDIYAKVLAGEDAMSKRPRGKKVSSRIPIRTKYFDDFVGRHTGRYDQSQLVSLGAGMDMRPYRLECITPLVSCYEVDVDEVVKSKEERLAGIQPAPRLRAASIVRIGSSLLSNQWVEELLQAGFDTERVRTIWVLEGIVYYFTDDQVKELFRKLRTLSSPGSVLCASALRAPPKNKTGPAFRSCIPDPERFLQEYGFNLIATDSYGEPSANYGRWDSQRPSGTYFLSGIKPIV